MPTLQAEYRRSVGRDITRYYQIPEQYRSDGADIVKSKRVADRGLSREKIRQEVSRYALRN